MNNYLNTSKNSDLEEVKEKSRDRTIRYSQRKRNENNPLVANTSIERRAAAKERVRNKRKDVIEKELVRAKAPATTGTIKETTPANLKDRFSKIDQLIKQQGK